jgi:ubiquinone biosynthesis protein
MEIVDLLAGIAQRDVDQVTQVVLEWTGDAHVDETRLAYDLDELIFDYGDVPLKDVRVATLLQQMNSVLREHSVVLPEDLTLMFKSFVTLEGLGRQYDPNFQLIDQLGPFLEEALAARHKPAMLVKRGQTSVVEFVNLLGSVPRDLARLVTDARRGKMRVDLDLKRLDSFGQRLDETIDRITIGIMTAALVIGSSIVMTVQSGPKLFGVPIMTVLGSIGYLVAFFNSVWIILSIWRSGRS